jgi:hypothetical protein
MIKIHSCDERPSSLLKKKRKTLKNEDGEKSQKNMI